MNAEGKLFAKEIYSGKTIWEVLTGNIRSYQIIILNEELLFIVGYFKLYKINLITGIVIWESPKYSIEQHYFENRIVYFKNFIRGNSNIDYEILAYDMDNCQLLEKVEV